VVKEFEKLRFEMLQKLSRGEEVVSRFCQELGVEVESDEEIDLIISFIMERKYLN